MRGEEEYTDYSCSTPLERLSRDVETTIRSWHIVQGSDRHVSFHHALGTGGDSRGNAKVSKGSPSRIQSMSKSPSFKKSRSKSRSTSFQNESSCRESEAPAAASREGVQLIRSAKLALSTPAVSVQLNLCLWDGPPSGSSSFFEKNSKNSKNSNSSVPLSLISNFNSALPQDLLSSLSSLFGIGQHLTLTPSDSQALEALLEPTMNALLSAHHPSRTTHPSTRTHASIFASFSNHSHPPQNPVQDIVTLHATALNSLSSMLQTALNTATSASDSRIPAFGIWGLYAPHRHNDNTNNNDSTNNLHVPLMHSIMDVPDYLNAGNLFDLAADSSPCAAFTIHSEQRLNQHQNNNTDTTATNTDKTDNSKQTHSRTTNKHNRRNRHYTSNNVSNTNSFHNHLSSSKSAASSSSSFTSQHKLFLPPLLSGYCHPGPSLFATRAYFAVHVVPPGVAYPIHCTTLNSLGQLLLQHCPPPPPLQQIHPDQTHPAQDDHLHTIHIPASPTSHSFHNKVIVSGARHKYHWSKLFDTYQDNDASLQRLHSQSTTRPQPNSFAHHSFYNGIHILTCGIQWRNSSIATFENKHKEMSDITQYQQECILRALQMLYRATDIADRKRKHQTSTSSSQKKTVIEPLWGPPDDPLQAISISTSWDSYRPQSSKSSSSLQSNTDQLPSSSLPNIAPLLTLPLRIRSHHSLSSHDVLEMENTILSTVFNPLTVPSSTFHVSISYDSHAACTTLSATNRCLFAALIRASTLESDALLGHLTKPNILQKLHDQQLLDDVAHEIMDAAHVGNVTKRLVEVMDWASMANMAEEELAAARNTAASGNSASAMPGTTNNERLRYIVNAVLDGAELRGYPTPPVEAFNPQNSSSTTNPLDAHSCKHHFLPKASPPGRLLSVLFTCMASLRTPSAMAGLWLEFVAELRLRWERKETLQNMGHVPGLDNHNDSDRYVIDDEGNEHIGSSYKNKTMHDTIRQFNSLGSSAINAAYLNSSEPDPNVNDCLINQKLQVFNIGVESIIASESEELRKMQTQYKHYPQQDTEFDTAAKEEEDMNDRRQTSLPHSIVTQKSHGDETKDSCSQNDAETEILGNVTGMYSKDKGNLNDGLTPLKIATHCLKENSKEEEGGCGVRSMDTDNSTFLSPTSDRETLSVSKSQERRPTSPSAESTDSDANFYDAVDEEYVTSPKAAMIMEEAATNMESRQSRRGARCPVHGINLVASGDQLYAPYLQRTSPLTDDVLLQRRHILGGGRDNDESFPNNSSNQSRISIAHRLQKPKLLSDMCAFKAANPGSVFEDFTNWYGNPENPLREYGEENFAAQHHHVSDNLDNSNNEAIEDSQVLAATRSFWSDTWDEALPSPASEQDPLFDAFSTVEMLLLTFESLHPAHLMNQIMAVNLATSNFILRSSTLGKHINLINNAIDKLSSKTEEALFRLGRDMMEGTTPALNTSQGDSAFKYVSSDTIIECEHACDLIADVEILLSRATSLLSKFPGEYDLVQHLLQSTEGKVDSYEGRQGILNIIRGQQQINSGQEDIGLNDLPFPSVREYILQNQNNNCPCQLAVRIGGTHGLEKGGNNSTRGGLVLSLSKSISDF